VANNYQLIHLFPSTSLLDTKKENVKRWTMVKNKVDATMVAVLR